MIISFHMYLCNISLLHKVASMRYRSFYPTIFARNLSHISTDMFWAFQLAETGKIDDHVNVLTEEGGRE
jgi:hypothetical protein